MDSGERVEKAVNDAPSEKQDDDIDHINDLWQEVYSSNLTTTEQLPTEVHRNCGLLSQVANSQQNYLSKLKENSLEYIQAKLEGQDASEFLRQISSNSADAQRLADERVSISTNLRDIINRNIKLIETSIENQQTELQMGVRPGTQPSHNEQLKKERDNRMRSRAAREEQERVENENNEDDERYCFCNQVSFGEMVGCDNEQCPYQWFHLACIGLTEAPSNEFICSFCQQQDGVQDGEQEKNEQEEQDEQDENEVDEKA